MRKTYISRFGDQNGNKPRPHAAGGIPVTYIVPPEEARKTASRAMNLKFVLEHGFDGSLIAMSACCEMMIERLRALMDGSARLDAAVAEHIERTLGLPGGWLDQQRSALTSEEKEMLRRISLSDEQAVEMSNEAIGHKKADALHEKTTQAGLNENDAKNEDQELPMSTEHQADESMDNGTAQGAKEAQEQKDAMDPFLVALDRALSKGPRGTRSRFARHANQSPSDLSAWLRGLRPIPRKSLMVIKEATLTFDRDIVGELCDLLDEHGIKRSVNATNLPNDVALSDQEASDATRSQEIALTNGTPDQTKGSEGLAKLEEQEEKIVNTVQEAMHILSILVERRRARRDRKVNNPRLKSQALL